MSILRKYTGRSTIWLSVNVTAQMVFKYVLSFLWNPGLATARGTDSAAHSASEAPGQDGWCE